MNDKNSTNTMGMSVFKYVHRGQTFYEEVIKKLDGKKILWTMLNIGGFLFVASILFLLVMLIVTS